MKLKIDISKCRAPYVEVYGELKYDLSADEAADILRQVWNEKIIPLQVALSEADAERKDCEGKLQARVMAKMQ